MPAEQAQATVAGSRPPSHTGSPLPRNGFLAGKDDAFGLFERSILPLGYFTKRA